MLTLQTIPIELLVRIASFLTIPELVQLAWVSNSLSTLILTSPELWKRVHFICHSKWKHVDQLINFIHQQKSLIQFLTLENVRDDVVSDVLTACTHMKALKFHRWTTLSDHAFMNVGTNLFFNHLHTLELLDHGGMYSAIGSASVIRLAKACPLLSHFHLWCNAMIDPNATLILFQLCTGLQSFSLSSAQLHHDSDFQRFFSLRPTLTYLNVSHCYQLTDNFFHSLLSSSSSSLMNHLKTLCIHGAHQVTDQGVVQLQSIPSLTTFKFLDCPKISFGAMEKIGFESVVYTPAILHKPCFKVGIGFGFQRKPFSFSNPIPPPMMTPSSYSSYNTLNHNSSDTNNDEDEDDNDTNAETQTSSSTVSVPISIWA